MADERMRGAAPFTLDDLDRPTVPEMVARYLRLLHFDGLWREDGEDGCGCGLDDLAPCGEMTDGCRAGYRWPDDTFRPTKPPTEQKTD